MRGVEHGHGQLDLAGGGVHLGEWARGLVEVERTVAGDGVRHWVREL